MPLDLTQLSQITEPLLAWYEKNARVLPWRENTDAYRVWGIGNYAAADKSGYGDSVLRALFTAFSGCGGTCRGTGAGAFKNVGGAWILFEGAKYAESCTADL